MSSLGVRGKEEAQTSFPRSRPFFWEGLETRFFAAERKGFPSGVVRRTTGEVDKSFHKTTNEKPPIQLPDGKPVEHERGSLAELFRWFLTEGHIPHNPRQSARSA
jgi:hypothetical protein